VFGAYSQIGYFLLPALAADGHRVLALSRVPREGFIRDMPEVVWREYSNEYLAVALAGEDSLRNVIYLGPLKVLPELLPGLVERGVRRVIALGSTGRFYKTDSGDRREREMIALLIAAEERVAARSEELGIHWTIFRPTLVYGCGMDKNITLIVRFIRRFGFFPLIGSGKGLRQPVHAADLANACVSALANSETYSKAYNLSGGGELTYREMVEAIFRATGRKPRFLRVPLPALRFALRAARLLPRLRYLNPEMADRINLDACFDHSEAARDLEFHPRPFAPDTLAVSGPGPGSS
jgi:nucleoside-diphosphate-sugar epimerase